MKLNKAKANMEYEITSIDTDNYEMEDFLFTLGCYPGEKVTIISKLTSNFVICIKDARYSIDEELAKCIEVK